MLLSSLCGLLYVAMCVMCVLTFLLGLNVALLYQELYESIFLLIFHIIATTLATYSVVFAKGMNPHSNNVPTIRAMMIMMIQALF